MKDILNGLQTSEKKLTAEYLALFQDSGLNPILIKERVALGAGFIVITEAKIKEYLRKKQQDFILRHALKLHHSKEETYYWTDVETALCIAVTASFWWKTFELVCIWKEERLINIQAIPPTFALNKIVQVKEQKLFDFLTVATVSVGKRPLKDPFLIGRISGSSNRYFLCQWGDDLKADDFI